MKNRLFTLLALSSAYLLMLSACKKDGALVTATTGMPGTLTATSTTIVLNKANVNDATTPAVTFNFTQANYGFSAAVTNTLQIDKAGDNWANPTSVTLGANTLTQSYSTPAFNSILLKMGLVGGVTSTVNVRIVQSISTSITPVYSNVVALTVTPFNLAAWLYVVGQFNGYSTATPDSLLSPTSNGIYYGVINFTTGNTRFLVLPAKNYNNKYATITNPPSGTATTLTYATEYVSSGGNDLYAPSTPGQYLVTLNTNANTITVALTNTYSAIGATAADAGGYSIDVPLAKFVNDGSTGWTSVIAFRTGDFKIRQNNDWNWSWGIPKSGSDGDGVANTLNDNSNNNIPISVAGNYKVSFNIVPFPLTTPVSNSVPPSSTATYSLIKQ